MSTNANKDAAQDGAETTSGQREPARKTYTLTPDGDYAAPDGERLSAEEVRRRMMANRMVVAGGFQDMMARVLSARVTSVTL